MKAIILAAGRGSRMKHLTEAQPKCLINLRGKPLVEWQLEAMRCAGITEIAIVTGYKKELLASYEVIKFHNMHWSKTDMVFSLSCADKWLKAGPCIVSYSDIFYQTSAINSLINCPEPLAITYDPNWLNIWKTRFEDPLLDAEVFKINSSNQITKIGSKPKSLEEVQGQYMGLIKITPESWGKIVSVLAKFPRNIRNKMQMTSVLQNVIEHTNYPVIGLPYEGEWWEIDTYNDLIKFNNN